MVRSHGLHSPHRVTVSSTMFTSYATLSSGILKEYLTRHSHFSRCTHEPLGECAYQENTSEIFQGIARESVA